MEGAASILIFTRRCQISDPLGKKKIKKKTFSMGSPTLASALLTQQQVVDVSGVWTGTYSHRKQVHNKKNPIQKK